jgi:hypothetical protein
MLAQVPEPDARRCPGCAQPYQGLTRVPLVLRCGHSTCATCLSSTTASGPAEVVRCVTCGRISLREQLVRNHTLLELLRESQVGEARVSLLSSVMLSFCGIVLTAKLAVFSLFSLVLCSATPSSLTTCPGALVCLLSPVVFSSLALLLLVHLLARALPSAQNQEVTARMIATKRVMVLFSTGWTTLPRRTSLAAAAVASPLPPPHTALLPMRHSHPPPTKHSHARLLMCPLQAAGGWLWRLLRLCRA